MPVRLLNLSILKWPTEKVVDQEMRKWARKVISDHHNVLKIGYFGSYAKGHWGVGSDLDIILITKHTKSPFERRALEYDISMLPVPADLVVYTINEWQSSSMKKRKFLKDLHDNTIWVY